MKPLTHEEMPEAIEMAMEAGKTKPITRDRKLEYLRLQTIAERRAWNSAVKSEVYAAFCSLCPEGKVWSKKRAAAEIKKRFKVGDAVSVGPFGATYKGPLYGIVFAVRHQYVHVLVVERDGRKVWSEGIKAQAWDLRKMKEVNE